MRPIPTSAPTSTPTSAPTSARAFWRHGAEMVLAMAVGALVLGPLWPLPQDLAHRPDVASLVTATDMSLAMAVWMRHRGHRDATIGEMVAAMVLPHAVLLVPWYAGLVPAGPVAVGGHLLMVPAMLLAMLRRPAEYAAPHPPAARAGWLSRWPTVLAVLVTADAVVDPRPLPPWTVLVLPAGYLAIGAFRRTLRPPAVLRVQLAGAAGYLLLAVAALVAPGSPGTVLVGLGWLAHAGWDWWHHRRDAVVPRAYAEWCGVVDVVVGVSVLASVVVG